MRPIQATIALVLLLTACLGDPAGPAVLDVGVVGAGIDTVWVGAPGEPLPAGVRLLVSDDAGRPLPGASLEWEAIGRNAQVLNAVARSNSAGVATASWQLGSDAAEEQQLRVTVRASRKENQIIIRARAVPHVVSQLRVAVDTPAVVRLGDTLPVRVIATDPYGNEFPAPDVALSISDSTVAAIVGSSFVGGRRGVAFVRVASGAVTVFFPLRVKQYVAAIVPVSDSLHFSALGAQRPVAYVVRDDRGRVVADTTVAIAVADAAVARLEGEYVRALSLGVTTLRLTLGPASAAIVVGVQQRVGSLALVRDTIRLDALRDTTTVNPIVHDSLGSPIANPDLVYDVSDRQIAKFSGGRTLEAVKAGSAIVTVRDSTTSVSTSAPVIVRQVIASIDLPSAQISFDALGDTLTVSAVARDRLGSVVEGAALQYAVSDSSVVAVQSGSHLRSVAPGQTLVVVTDPETGIVGTAVLKVEQRAAAVRLASRAVSFDALGDTLPLTVSVSDRLGAPIANAPATYRSTDPAVVAVTAGGVVTSQENGSALLIAESPDGPADTAQVTVAQRVNAIVVGGGRDTLAFEALRAVQGAQAVAVDRRGAPVRSATFAYAVEDTALATVDQAGQVHAVANGATRLLAVAGGDTAVISLRIAQRPVRVVASPDTIRFDAFGDVRAVSAVALDSLGSPVAGGVTSVIPADVAVADTSDSVTVVARGNGVSTASVTVAGIAGQVVVVVDQVAASLNVAVRFGNPIVTLPAGSALPLSCAAADRNGNAIARDAALVRTVKGTVAGGGCADATIQHSGYDTLVFAMGGVQARVPVIVSTGDSVAVLSAAQPLTTVDRIRFVGEDLTNPSILALRPLVRDILAAYGNPTSDLERARVLRDWLSRTAVHPYRALHPDGSTSNLSVLPLGTTWADANTAGNSKVNLDSQFWGAVGMDGYAMLDRLLGTLDPATGRRADDGMMAEVEGARYRIRDLATYHYVLCSYQDIMLNALWAAAGLHGMLISTVGHDPAAVFIPELGRWIYEDPEFNEEYLLDGVGEPLSPTELLTRSGAGEAGRLRATKHLGPTFDPEVYIATEAYINASQPGGYLIMGSQLNNRVVGIGGWPMRYVQIDVPQLAQEVPFNDSIAFARVTPEVAFPTLGPVVVDLRVEDSVYVVQLSSTFPNHQRFERRFDGLNWETVSDVDVLPVGATKVEYRSVDAGGSVSTSAVLDVWAPRTSDFLQSAIPGSVRAQARYYVSP